MFFRGIWVAQQVKRPTLDLSSGFDLRVVESSPALGPCRWPCQRGAMAQKGITALSSLGQSHQMEGAALEFPSSPTESPFLQVSCCITILKGKQCWKGLRFLQCAFQEPLPQRLHFLPLLPTPTLPTHPLDTKNQTVGLLSFYSLSLSLRAAHLSPVLAAQSYMPFLYLGFLSCEMG